jgi:hypothetical protein
LIIPQPIEPLTQHHYIPNAALATARLTCGAISPTASTDMPTMAQESEVGRPAVLKTAEAEHQHDQDDGAASEPDGNETKRAQEAGPILIPTKAELRRATRPNSSGLTSRPSRVIAGSIPA